MHALSLISISAALATLSAAAPLVERAIAFTAPKGTGSFNLEVITTDGKTTFSGNWLIPYHTGAGTSVLTLIDDQSEAQKFNFSTSGGDVTAILGSYPAYLDLATSDFYAPPKHYTFAGFDTVAGPKNNFTFTTPENYLQFPAADKTDDYVFSICPADIYTPGVFIDTLVYKKLSAPKNATCADVMVKAVF